MAPLPVLNMHRGKCYLNVLPFPPAPWCLAKRHQQELTLYHYMAQQVLTHPRTDQSFCFRALSSGAKAIAAAAAGAAAAAVAAAAALVRGGCLRINVY